ncbi:hypothetical protein G3480_23970, partial [Thiorhodococcus mannitoliphagus]|nr:hypothetical protein [Thiorhodococcus mannitoliphagus]
MPALLGGLLAEGLSRELAIVSDGAGQFAILLHALCWMRAERLIHKLIPLNERRRQDQERVRDEVWTLSRSLELLRSYRLGVATKTGAIQPPFWTADIAWRVLEHRDLTTDAVLRLIRADDVESTDGVALIDGDV